MFAPVVKHEEIRLLIKLAAINGLHVSHYDIKTAFLYGDLEETLYMEQPAGFIENPNLGCKLSKSIYGLKQSLGCWNAKVDQTLKIQGFKQAVADSCWSVKQNGQRLVFCVIYVGEILLICKTEKRSEELEKHVEKYI